MPLFRCRKATSSAFVTAIAVVAGLFLRPAAGFFTSGLESPQQSGVLLFAETGQVRPTPQRSSPQEEDTEDSQRRFRARRERAARQLEIRGNYDPALSIYEELLELAPDDPSYFEGVIRCLVAKGEYAEAAARLEKRIESDRSRGNPAPLYAELGAVYHQMGKTNQAEIAWKQALSSVPGSTGSYLALAQVFIRLRMIDRAVEVLREARDELGDPTLFSINLATLLQSRMDWAGAAEEYLKSLASGRSRLGWIKRSLAGFPDDEAANEAVLEAVRSALEEHRDSEPWKGYYTALKEILAEQHMKNGDYNQAVEVLREVAGAGDRPHVRLIRFAEEAGIEGAYDAARRALEIADDFADSPRDRLEVELARAELAVDMDQPALADSLLTNLCEDQTGGIIDLRPWTRRGILRLTMLDDPAGAMSDFEKILEEIPGNANEEVEYLGAIALAHLGRLEEADELLATLNVDHRSRRWRTGRSPTDFDISPFDRKNAPFLRARIAWWMGMKEKAISLLADFLAHPRGDDRENDAIAFRHLLQSGTADSTTLSRLAEADRAEFTGDPEEARAIYKQVAADRENVLAAEALWRLAEIELDDPGADPAGALEEITRRYPEHPRAEEAWLQLGEWWETRGDTAKAVESYETLLVEYPEGLLNGEARLRLDRLAGNILPPLLPEPELQIDPEELIRPGEE